MTGGTPGRVAVWRHACEHGRLLPDADQEWQLTQLAAHGGQRTVVALDQSLDRAPGAQRLEEVVDVLLDLALGTSGARTLLSTATGRARVLLDQQQALLVRMLGEDLAALGVPEPARAAVDLLGRIGDLVVLEDAAGRPLRRRRAALVAAATGAAVVAARPSLLRRWHLVPA